MSKKMVVLACQQLCRTYHDGKNKVPVLRGIDFVIDKNDTAAIVGASGCGKSTLLQLLGGLDRPTSGKVFWNGQNVNVLSETKRCRQRNRQIGFIYQFHHLLPEFTALENVALPLLIRGLSSVQAKNRAREVLVAVGLEKRTRHKVGELSGGERQRTAVARALIIEPDCVLADEPTGNLDQQTAWQVLEVMLSLQHQFKTSFVIVTHDEKLARRLNHTYHIVDGHLSRI